MGINISESVKTMRAMKPGDHLLIIHKDMKCHRRQTKSGNKILACMLSRAAVRSKAIGLGIWHVTHQKGEGIALVWREE